MNIKEPSIRTGKLANTPNELSRNPLDSRRDMPKIKQTNMPQVNRLHKQHLLRDHAQGDLVPDFPKRLILLQRRNTKHTTAFALRDRHKRWDGVLRRGKRRRGDEKTRECDCGTLEEPEGVEGFGILPAGDGP